MGYKKPSLEELTNLITILKNKYDGDDPQRLGFLTLAEKITKQIESHQIEPAKARKILMGAYLFEMGKIASEYRVFSVNSKLHGLIVAGLKINADNKPCEEDKLINLTAFYHYVKQSTNSLFADTYWRTKDALQKELISVIKAAISKQKTHVNCLLTSLPTSEQLRINMQGTEKEYNRLSPKGWLSGGAHKDEARLLDLINDYCSKYVDSGKDTTEDSPGFQIRMGAYIYTMRMIEDSYLVRSGKTSSLYSMCMNATNIKRTKDIDIFDKGKWLTRLQVCINDMLDSHQDFLKEKEKSGYKNIERKLRLMLASIGKQVVVINIEQASPTKAEEKLSAAATYGVTSALSGGLGVVIRSPLGYVFDGAMSMAGFAVFGPGGALIGGTLGNVVRNRILPTAVAGLFSEVLHKIGKAIGKTVTGVFVLPVTFTYHGLRRLIDYYYKVELDPKALRRNKEYIESLMSLPNDAFSADKKDILAKTFGEQKAQVSSVSSIGMFANDDKIKPAEDYNNNNNDELEAHRKYH